MKFSAKCRVEIRQRAASEGQRGGRRGQEGGLFLYIGLAGALSLQTMIKNLLVLHQCMNPEISCHRNTCRLLLSFLAKIFWSGWYLVFHRPEPISDFNRAWGRCNEVLLLDQMYCFGPCFWYAFFCSCQKRKKKKPLKNQWVTMGMNGFTYICFFISSNFFSHNLYLNMSNPWQFYQRKTQRCK